MFGCVGRGGGVVSEKIDTQVFFTNQDVLYLAKQKDDMKYMFLQINTQRNLGTPERTTK